MDEPESYNAADDSGLEISDLPGTGGAPRHRRHTRIFAFAHRLATRPRLRRRAWQAGTAGGALLLMVCVLFGSFPQVGQSIQHLFGHTTPTTAHQTQSNSSIDLQDITSQYTTKKVIFWDASTPPVVPLNSTLDTAPQSCLRSTPLQDFATPLYPPGVGGSPAWVTGFTGPDALLNHLSRAPRPQDGWYQPLLIASETNFTGAIVLRAGIASSSFPLWFGSPSGNSLVRTVTLYPLDTSVSNHTTDDQQWDFTLVNLYIPRAGCYDLSATWNGGSWTAYFAAGR